MVYRRIEKQKTYNTRDSLVVTDPATGMPFTGLSMGERTGSRASQWVWSYVPVSAWELDYVVSRLSREERGSRMSTGHSEAA